MGTEIHISLENDKYDDQELAPFLGRDFYYEITQGAIWENKKPFLSNVEIELLAAKYVEDSLKPINPTDLKNVLKKVQKYLKDHINVLPFEIEIDLNRMEKEGLESDLRVQGSRCWIKGDSLYYEVSQKFEIISYPREPNEINLWIDYAEEIWVDGKKYYFKKISRFEKYARTIAQVIAFCRIAEDKDEKIYWCYSH